MSAKRTRSSKSANPSQASNVPYWSLRGDAGTLKSGQWRIDADDRTWWYAMSDRIVAGRSMKPGEWPAVPPRFTYEKVATNPDISGRDLGSSAYVVSDRFKAILEELAPGAAEFLPVSVDGPGRSALHKTYWAVNWLLVWSCQPDDRIAELDTRHIPAPSAIGIVGGKGWWYGDEIIVRDDIKKKLEEYNLIGLRFEKIKLATPATAKVVRFNHTTRKNETLERKLIPHDRHFDLDAYIASGRGVNDKGIFPGGTAFYEHVMFHSVTEEKLKKFLKHAGDINVSGPQISTLLLNIKPKSPAILKILDEHGADWNLDNTIGHTPLMSIARPGMYESLKTMLGFKVNVNQRDHLGRTALFHLVDEVRYASIPASRRCIKLFADSGCDFNATDTTGTTPFMLLASLWSSESTPSIKAVLKQLLELGASPNGRFVDKKLFTGYPAGLTPLMIRKYDDGSIHLAMIKSGADVHATDKRGKTALDHVTLHLKGENITDRKGAQSVQRALKTAMNL